MEFDGIEQAWRLQEGGRGEAFRRDAEQTVRLMERKRKRQQVVLAFFALMTLASTVFVGVIFWRRPGIDWREVWPVVLVQAGSLLTLAALVRAKMQQRRGYQRCGASVREAVGWALGDIQRQVSEMKILLIGAIFAAPLLALQVVNLYSSGKMDARAAGSFASLCVAVFVVNGIVWGTRFRYRLRPERQRLSAILGELGE